jgi:hypothetical protein
LKRESAFSHEVTSRECDFTAFSYSIQVSALPMVHLSQVEYKLISADDVEEMFKLEQQCVIASNRSSYELTIVQVSLLMRQLALKNFGTAVCPSSSLIL